MLTENAITLSHDLNLADIDALRSCAPDMLITLWTLQQPGAIEHLENEGQLTGKPKFAFKDYKKPGKQAAYRWMQDQLRQRMDTYDGSLPIWLMLSKPAKQENGIGRQNDYLLCVRVPKKRILISFCQPWEHLLGIMASLEKNSWPPRSESAFFVADDNEAAQRAEDCNKLPPEDVCRRSWEKMFDLSLAQNQGFKWKPFCLQAMLPSLYQEDVIEIISPRDRG